MNGYEEITLRETLDVDVVELAQVRKNLRLLANDRYQPVANIPDLVAAAELCDLVLDRFASKGVVTV